MSQPPTRDRDAAGRARNARPRDAAGRPLPRGAPGVDRVPEDLELTAEEAVDHAQQLLDEGLPFAAHEVLEASWKAAPPGERPLWRALAQLAVGLTHLQRGNTRGALALVRRGGEGLAAWDGSPPAGIDVDGLVRWSGELVARIGSGEEPRSGAEGRESGGRPSLRLRRDL
ncbi:MAG TPA: DUF309 domain-containing protein [Pseudonocardia sp.]|nr:DUF309 domain-containing protein [Pseudonocardia sp.]